MTPAARYAAAITILDAFLGGGPVEKTLSNWARRNRYAGSKDRAAVRDITFDCLRNLRSFQWAAGGEGARALTIGHCLMQGTELHQIFSGIGYAPDVLSAEESTVLVRQDKQMPDGVKADLPDWLLDQFRLSLGDAFERTTEILKSRAPVDLRVNLRKCGLPAAQKALEAVGIGTETVDLAATALRVTSNPRRIASSEPYVSGQIELQDAASQAVVAHLPLANAARILDYCAGGGGKTLAMAALAPEAKISAFDQSAARLEPLRERARRAGATVTLLDDSSQIKNDSYDLVLIDVPCSGAGAWRRNPEGKWRITEHGLHDLCGLQSEILQSAAPLVAEGGHLAYVTCSVLTCENEDRINAFLRASTAWKIELQKRFNLSDGGDGFFLTVLSRS
ncbi:MAG: RsmB/NOP family class I SAM-dependent RNA methyltransferase [Rhodobacteraceae bacterium]|nr:RsmB/NOP family class I SAM-dependent RNA methyltransferase [Paracoccaceae bacterium]